MADRSSRLAAESFAVLAKDITVEFRSRHAIQTLGLFGITTLIAVSFALAGAELTPRVQAALFWIIILFTSLTSLAHAFVREEESGTILALRSTTAPLAAFWGKFSFNALLILLLTIILVPLFVLFLSPPPFPWGEATLLLGLGLLDICAATTIIGAIMAKSTARGGLFSVLALPILIPLMLVLVRATATLFESGGSGANGESLQFLAAYGGVMLTGSVLLFRYVWDE